MNVKERKDKIKKEYQKIYYLKNKKVILAKSHVYYLKNRYKNMI